MFFIKNKCTFAIEIIIYKNKSNMKKVFLFVAIIAATMVSCTPKSASSANNAADSTKVDSVSVVDSVKTDSVK